MVNDFLRILKRDNTLHVLIELKNMQYCSLNFCQVDQSLQMHATLQRLLTEHRWKSYRCKSSSMTLPLKLVLYNFLKTCLAMALQEKLQ